jgi:hypothetical protein
MMQYYRLRWWAGGGLAGRLRRLPARTLVPSQPAIQLKEFPVKKIALSVLIASTFALAACGSSTPANNGAADLMNTANEAITDVNAATAQAMNDMQNQAAGVTNELNAAASQASAAANDMSNAAAAATNAH